MAHADAASCHEHCGEPQLCTAENVAVAVKSLETVHLVGALDLAAGLKASDRASALRGDARELGGLTPYRSPVVVHVGSGMPALGDRDAAKLAELIPKDAEYVGIGVGRRWNESMMKQAASRTGGLWTQINPDDEIAWRAFDVFHKLHLPRWQRMEPGSRDFRRQSRRSGSYCKQCDGRREIRIW